MEKLKVEALLEEILNISISDNDLRNEEVFTLSESELAEITLTPETLNLLEELKSAYASLEA